jgi:hypothetical protein
MNIPHQQNAECQDSRTIRDKKIAFISECFYGSQKDLLIKKVDSIKSIEIQGLTGFVKINFHDGSTGLY